MVDELEIDSVECLVDYLDSMMDEPSVDYSVGMKAYSLVELKGN